MAPLVAGLDARWRRVHGLIAGVDEAGRGPLAGPVVAAAVVLPLRFVCPDLDDSKKKTPEQREVLFSRIVDKALAIGVGIVEPDEIDRINIYHASVRAMNHALAELGDVPDYVLVDGRPIQTLRCAHHAIVDGDAKSRSIAAASIVAKVTRDRIMAAMDDVYPGYAFARHKGYGTPHHLERLRALGPCPLHRRSFAPVLQSF